jgi:predicted nucleic acid-binding protein
VGLILDSSVLVIAERQGNSVSQFIEQLLASAGDQAAALSAVGLTELVHGIYRAPTLQRRSRRQAFIDELLNNFAVYPYTSATSLLAGKISGEQQALGFTIPFSDLLIGATALELGFSVLTTNLRHFRLIPGLNVIPY